MHHETTIMDTAHSTGLLGDQLGYCTYMLPFYDYDYDALPLALASLPCQEVSINLFTGNFVGDTELMPVAR